MEKEFGWFPIHLYFRLIIFQVGRRKEGENNPLDDMWSPSSSSTSSAESFWLTAQFNSINNKLKNETKKKKRRFPCPACWQMRRSWVKDAVTQCHVLTIPIDTSTFWAKFGYKTLIPVSQIKNKVRKKTGHYVCIRCIRCCNRTRFGQLKCYF